MTTPTSLTAAFLATRENVDFVYGDEREQEIAGRVRLLSPTPVVEPASIEAECDRLQDVDVIFSTWGMPSLTSEELSKYLPRLKAVFYAAGSVQDFARPLLERGIVVVSAWRANAKAVAQYTTAQTMLAVKGYFRNLREYDGGSQTSATAFRGRGAYGETVALLGAGAIGRLVIERLREYDFCVVVWDPFLSSDAAAQLKVEKIETLREAFEQGYVVSNHLADNAETEGLLTPELFRLMRPNATFINTGRGRTVDQAGLVDVMSSRPDLTALLDVTYPEPPGSGSPIMSMANVYVTSHIAGTIGDEVRRMADLCIREFDRFANGESLHHSVSLDNLRTMA